MNPYFLERTNGRMIKVKARGNESIEQMLRRFKKMCEKEGLTKEIKRTSYYEKPSERRRRRMRKALKREQRFMSPEPFRSR
jgi:small subunit ribosomal protein S21